MKFLKFWFPVLSYSGIIFYISSVPHLEAPYSQYFSDKAIHIFEYAILGYLWQRALVKTTTFPRKSIIITAVIFCTLYGLSDEIHQSFVPGRECAVTDWLADLIGGTIGSFLYPFKLTSLKR